MWKGQFNLFLTHQYLPSTGLSLSQKRQVKQASLLCSTAACGCSRPCERSPPEAELGSLRWSTAGPWEGAGRWRWFPPAQSAAPGWCISLRGTWRKAGGSWRCTSRGFGWPSPQPEQSPCPLWAEARDRGVLNQRRWVWAVLQTRVRRQL